MSSCAVSTFTGDPDLDLRSSITGSHFSKRQIGAGLSKRWRRDRWARRKCRWRRIAHCALEGNLTCVLDGIELASEVASESGLSVEVMIEVGIH